MEVKGTVKLKLAAESGVSKSGKEWKKQSIVIDTGGEFNNEVAVSAFGDEKLKQMDKLEVGMEVKILCNVYSREYNGRYFHNIDGYHFTQHFNSGASVEYSTTPPTVESDDLPF